MVIQIIFYLIIDMYSYMIVKFPCKYERLLLAGADPFPILIHGMFSSNAANSASFALKIIATRGALYNRIL